ncbi:MAG: hypothetical protein ABIQ30_14910 [Devosia sp.]
MATQHNRIGFWPLAIYWALIAAALAGRALATSGTSPLITDTDDAMRLTMVHDFLGGQGWFDLMQHRLNTPYGGEMHWSRLIDLPEAILLLVLRPVFGGLADTVAAYAWPLGLLALLLWATAKLALRMGGRIAVPPALLLPAFSLIVMAEFAPGRFDHHSAQILVTLAMLYCAIEALHRPRFAIGAGLAAAAALAIGIEGVPMVGITVLVFGLAWVANGKRSVALRDFGLSFALAMVLALAQGVAPDRWFNPVSDAISIVYTGGAILCGLAFLNLSLLPLRTPSMRFAAGALAGAIAIGIVVAIDPDIVKGPYGHLDPWLVTNWLNRVSEAEPWLKSLMGEPVYPMAVLIPCLVALAVTVRMILRDRPNREAWFVYGAFFAAAVLVMLLQIRAARIALPLSVPACALLVGAAWQRMVSTRGFAPILATMGAAIASASIAVAVVATAVVLAFPDYAAATDDPYRAQRQACLMPSAFTDLAGLPPERIMAPIDLGSHILLYTPHSVVAAPYHRNGSAVRDAFHFFNDPIEDARIVLEQRGIGLVVICPAMGEIRGLVDHAPDSFVALYAAGKLPSWLVDQSLPNSPLRIYAVMPR